MGEYEKRRAVIEEIMGVLLDEDEVYGHALEVSGSMVVEVGGFIYDKLKEKGMLNVAEYSKMLARELPSLQVEITVGFFNSLKVGEGANYGGRHLGFNIARLGKAWFDEITPHVTALIIHELSHHRNMGVGHDHNYYKALERLTGEAVHLALEKPELFKPFMGVK